MNFINSSLLTKLLAPMGVVFIIMGSILIVYFSTAVRDNAEASALPAAISTVQQYKAIRGYYTQNVVKKVLAGSTMTPHFNHKTNPKHIPLPATFIHDLSEEFSKQGMTLKLYSQYPFPNRANRRLDTFGQQAWKQLNSNPSQTFSQIETVNGQEVVRVAVADTMVAQGCVNCHNSHPDTPKTGWKIGDVRGVLEVQVPIDEQLAAGKALNVKLIIFLLLALVISTICLIVVFRLQVSKRLVQISDALEDIVKGDGTLNRRLDDSSGDEVGGIAKAFNDFVQPMESSLREIGTQVGQLVSTSQSLADITQRSQQGAASQQQETDQVAAAMNEMTATVQEVANLATNTSESAQQAQTDAEEGRQVVTANMQSVENLSHEIQQAAEVVARLDTDSQNIGGVLDVIRGIAEQTNLLALNAAIEAARAGEQGRGFAVVADEVRTLASRTQASTEEIQQMIEQLQSGAKNAVTSIEQGNQSLQASLDKANQTKEVIETIAEATNNIRDLNVHIATAAEEQTSVTNEINRNITNIADVATANTQDAQQLQNSVDEIRHTIESVNRQLEQFTKR